MMIDYSKMSDKKLDKLSAKIIMKWNIYIKTRAKFGPIATYDIGCSDARKHISVKNWKPTHKDSTQATTYILKALMKKYGDDIYWKISGMFGYVYVGMFERGTWKAGRKSQGTAWEWCQEKPAYLDLIYENWSVDYETVNRAIVIASLRALDHFNKEKPEQSRKAGQ